MAQATNPTPQAPPGYGRAFADMLYRARNLTHKHSDALSAALGTVDPTVQDAATRRLDEALDLLGIEEALFSGPVAAVDATYAVLARDRGLITTADFDTLVAPWRAAGLAIPTGITGDEDADPLAALDDMTSDRLADQLSAAGVGTDHYGAVLALVGYNFGELLAYPQIRKLIDRHHGGQLMIDWKGLDAADTAGQLSELTPEALQFVAFALALVPSQGLEHPGMPADPANAEVLVQALAYANDLDIMLDPHWETRDRGLTPSPAVIPLPRAEAASA